MSEHIREFNYRTISFLDIVSYLNTNPDFKIRLNGDRLLTYERVNDEKGYMVAVRILETGIVEDVRHLV